MLLQEAPLAGLVPVAAAVPVVVVVVVDPVECRAVVDDGSVVERQMRCETALLAEPLSMPWCCPCRVAEVPW